MSTKIKESDFYNDYLLVSNENSAAGSVYVKKDGGLEELRDAIEEYLKGPKFKVGDIVRLTGSAWDDRSTLPTAGTLQEITGHDSYGRPTFKNSAGSDLFVGKARATGADFSAELVGRVAHD